MLFNAGIEMAFRRWKLRLREHGFLLDVHHTRLTNLRYADDMMIFAKSPTELVQMTEWLVEELSNIGLHLNTAKTKVLTTTEDNTDFLDIGGNLVDVIADTTCHKYLGRYLPGNLYNRGEVECQHRFQAAWFAFHKHQKVLMNRHVPIKLRLKLFDSVVSPCVLFGMGVLPIYQKMMEKFDITRRKMLREMVGWVRYPEEEWSITMRRMNDRVDLALE